MIIVRNSFIAKPGLAGKLAAHMKEMAALGKLQNARILTDLTGDFNHVVFEFEVASMSALEEAMKTYMSDPQVREKSKAYLDFWTSGKRELYQVA